MASKRGKVRSSALDGIALLIIFLVFGGMGVVSEAIGDVVLTDTQLHAIFGIIIFAVTIYAFVLVRKIVVNRQRRELLQEILDMLQLNNIDLRLREYDDVLIVKSKQTLSTYSDLKYFKERENFESVRMVSESRKAIHNTIHTFLSGNNYESRKQYDY